MAGVSPAELRYPRGYEVGRTADIHPEKIAAALGGVLVRDQAGQLSRVDLPHYNAFLTVRTLKGGKFPVVYFLTVMGQRSLDRTLWDTGLVLRRASVSFVDPPKEGETLSGKIGLVADGITIFKPEKLTETIVPFKNSASTVIVEASQLARARPNIHKRS